MKHKERFPSYHHLYIVHRVLMYIPWYKKRFINKIREEMIKYLEIEQ